MIMNTKLALNAKRQLNLIKINYMGNAQDVKCVGVSIADYKYWIMSIGVYIVLRYARHCWFKHLRKRNKVKLSQVT